MANRYWIGGTGNWSDTTHWSTTSGGTGGSNVPTTSDAVFFDANSGTGTVTTTTGATCLVLTYNSSTLNLTLGNSLLLTSRFTFTQGAITLGSYTLTCNDFQSSNSNTRSIDFGTGKILLTGSGATIWSLSTSTGMSCSGSKLVESNYSGSTGTRSFTLGTLSEANAINLSVTAGADTIQTSTSNGTLNNLDLTGFAGTFSNVSSKTLYGNLTISSDATLAAGTSAITFAATFGTKTITTANKTFDFPITFNGIGGTWEFQDALTQGSTRAFTITNGTVKLKSGATTTVGSFVTSGTNQKYLQSTTAGSQATLSDASGVNSVSYLTISDSFATGGATWDAFYSNGNVDAGNNTNWDFGATPVLGAEYEYKLRSFTEPRRF